MARKKGSSLISKYYHQVKQRAGNGGSLKRVCTLLCFGETCCLDTYIDSYAINIWVKKKEKSAPYRESCLLNLQAACSYESNHRPYLIGIDGAFYVFSSFKVCVWSTANIKQRGRNNFQIP